MANTTPYFVAGNPANQDNTGRVVTYSYLTPAYAATLAPETLTFETIVNVGTLTGAMTINLDVTNNAGIGSKITFYFVADSAGTHVVTFGTGCASTGTLSVAASKYGKATAEFNGAVWTVTSFATA
jgi:hypothetical protein